MEQCISPTFYPIKKAQRYAPKGLVLHITLFGPLFTSCPPFSFKKVKLSPNQTIWKCLCQWLVVKLEISEWVQNILLTGFVCFAYGAQEQNMMEDTNRRKRVVPGCVKIVWHICMSPCMFSLSPNYIAAACLNFAHLFIYFGMCFIYVFLPKTFIFTF